MGINKQQNNNHTKNTFITNWNIVYKIVLNGIG